MTRKTPAPLVNGFDSIFERAFPAAPGIDSMREMFDVATDLAHKQPTFPPHDVIRYDDERTYDIVLAIAGFSEDDIDVHVEDKYLVIQSKSLESEGQGTSPTADLDVGTPGQETYLHKGIAKRSFTQRFVLHDNMEVQGARMENGLLRVRLQRNQPESPPRKQIPINT